MSTIVLKKPGKAKALEVDPDLSQMAGLIDELGAMEAKVAEAKKLLKQYDEKRKALLTACKDICGSDEEFVEKGSLFRAEFGKCGLVRRVKDIARIREIVGDGTFLQLVKVNLTDIDAYLDPDEREQVLEVSRDGARGLKIVRREG